MEFESKLVQNGHATGLYNMLSCFPGSHNEMTATADVIALEIWQEVQKPIGATRVRDSLINRFQICPLKL